MIHLVVFSLMFTTLTLKSDKTDINQSEIIGFPCAHTHFGGRQVWSVPRYTMINQTDKRPGGCFECYICIWSLFTGTLNIWSKEMTVQVNEAFIKLKKLNKQNQRSEKQEKKNIDSGQQQLGTGKLSKSEKPER